MYMTSGVSFEPMPALIFVSKSEAVGLKRDLDIVMRLVELIHQRLLTVHLRPYPKWQRMLVFATGAMVPQPANSRLRDATVAHAAITVFFMWFPNIFSPFERVDGIICVIDSHKV